MATDKQIAANRINALKSTGPRTTAGKMKSALNSRKHGFSGAMTTVVRLEDHGEIYNLRQDLLDLYHPVNSQEIFALERVAVCQLSLIRAERLESGLFTTCLDKALDPEGEPFHPMCTELAGDGDIEVTRVQNRNFALGEGFQRATQNPHTWTLFLRYQAQAERRYRRAIQEFERLRALRGELEPAETEIPNEPDSPAQPEANIPDPIAEPVPIPPVGQAPPPARDPLVALPPTDATIPNPETSAIPPMPAGPPPRPIVPPAGTSAPLDVQ